MSLALSSARASLREPAWSSFLSQTAEPDRVNYCYVDDHISLIFFEFDGTLVATTEEHTTRQQEIQELQERAGMLRHRLEKLREWDITLGIMSKRTEADVLEALDLVGLRELFNGPTIFRAIGPEHKTGIIEGLCADAKLPRIQADELYRVLLIDHEIYELDLARDRGLQTFAAPNNNGLQEEDFSAIFIGMGLEMPPQGLAPMHEHVLTDTGTPPNELFPRSERIIRVWATGLIGTSLGLENMRSQCMNNEIELGPLNSFYDITEELARGGFVRIVSARHLASSKTCALSAVLLKDAGKESDEYFTARDTCNFILQMSAEAPHPNVMRYFDYFQSQDYMYGAMEVLTGQDLSKFLEEHVPVTMDLGRRLTIDALKGLAHFHSVLGVGLIHRDVNLHHLRFRSTGDKSSLVLTDVGYAVLAIPDEERQAVGTLLFMAPEVFTYRYNTQVDVWSLGVVCYIMLAGKPPWVQDRRSYKERKIIHNGRVGRALESRAIKKLPAEASDFLASLLVLDPSHRLTASEALEHAWLRESREKRFLGCIAQACKRVSAKGRDENY